MKVPTKTLERELIAQGHRRIIGVDEVGMACLAGPVVVCAIAVEPSFYDRWHAKLAWMRDSKMLQPHQREQFAVQLEKIPGLTWRIALREPEAIDRVNIYQASREAMREAIGALAAGEDDIVLVDGNKLIRNLDLTQRAIVGGDRKVWAIAAASILAKVHRDALMTAAAAQYPGYGFEKHKGYPTREHRAAIATLGRCSLHRASFRVLTTGAAGGSD